MFFFRSPSTSLVRGQWRLQVANRGSAGHPQHIALTVLTQVVAKPRVAPQLIVTRHPAVRDLRTSLVEHLQTLLGSRVIPHLLWHMAFLTSWLVPCPLLGQRQAEVEQGMVVATDVPHEDAHLAVVGLAPVTTPLAFDPHRMCAALGKAPRIEGDNAIGCPQLSDHLSNQDLDQRPVVPWRCADEVLHDQALDIDQGCYFLGILAWQVGEQPLAVEMHIALTSFG